MAADSLHRHLRARLRLRRGSSCCVGLAFRSLRARPGRGRRTVPFAPPPPPGGDPPSGSANGWDARAAGTRARGAPSPALQSRGGAAAAARTAYLFISDVCSRRHGNRSIFSGVTGAPLLSNLPGTRIAKRLPPLLLTILRPPLQSRPLLPGVESHPFTPPKLPLQLHPFLGMGIPVPRISRTPAISQLLFH